MTILEQVDPRYQRDIIKISTTKLTSIDDLHLANYTTSGKVSRQTLGNAYKTLHSTVRTQKFRVVCENIPYMVAMHLVRHTQGIDPYIQSRRPDIDGAPRGDEYRPTNYTFYANAQSLINMSLERMCCKHPSFETHDVFLMIRDEIKALDEDLAINMVPKCVMRNGLCPENTSCVLYKEVHDIFSDYYAQFKFNAFDNIKRCNCPPTKKEVI